MKSLQLFGAMDLRQVEMDMPVPGDDEVLVRTEYCGLCGSDRPRLLFGEVPFFPNTLGHEFSARVAAVGKNVKSVVPGDLVAVVPLIVCHHCKNCRTGHYGQCENKQFIGLRVENKGGFSEYNVLPECNVIKVPDGVSGWEAAMIEPISVALHAMFRSGMKPGSDIAVIGAGTIGKLIIQSARAMGAREIFVFDNVQSQLDDVAGNLADHCYNTSDEAFLDSYLRDTQGYGCPYVMEAVGIQPTVSLALKAASTNGNVVLVGYLDKPLAFTSAEVRLILENELNLLGVWQSYDLDFPGEAFRLGLYYLSRGVYDTKSMTDHIIRPDEIMTVCEDWKIPGKVRGKIIVDFR